MGDLLSDIRYSFRIFLQHPGFVATALLSLALGIGANTTIFSVINALILRSLPFQDPNRLIIITEKNTKDQEERIPTLSTVLAWKQQARSFEGLEGASRVLEAATLTGAGEAGRVQIQYVSSGALSLLGAKPALGRSFLPEDASSDSDTGIIISHGLWERRFGGDPKAIGRVLTLQSQARTVIGIMPPGFWIYPWTKEADVWLPLNPPDNRLTPDTRWLDVLARVRPGIPLKQAQAEMDVFFRQMEQDDPKTNRGWQLRMRLLQKWCFEDWEGELVLLLGAVGFVLLIACANVANLLLTRAAVREKEVAIRLSLGARRSRIIRQLLTESILLGLLGGALGILLAAGGIRLFVVLSEWFSPGEKVPVDATVLCFTLGISVLTGVLFGLAPALMGSKPNLSESLKEGGRRSAGEQRHLGRNLLVVSEVALAMILLVGTGLMVNSLFRLKAVNPGFNPKNLLMGTIELTDRKYREMLDKDMKRVTPQADTFYEQIGERLETLPGVESVGAISSMFWWTQFRIVGHPEPRAGDEPGAAFAEVNAGYFRTMQIALITGRTFTERDDERAPWVAVVNEALSRGYFPGERPVGKLIYLKFGDVSGRSFPEDRPREIVGVIADVKHWGQQSDPTPTLYVPHRQHIWLFPGGASIPHLFTSLYLRTAANPMNLTGSLRQVVAQVDKDQFVSDIMTMEQSLSSALAYQRFYVQLFGIFSGLALVLAVIGVYGVMSYSVSRRTHEIGVRVAIGASRRDVLLLILRQALKLTLAGVAIGVAAAIGLTRLIANWLYGVKAIDPVTFTIVSLILIAVGVLASYLPARRATRVDPVVALRYE